MLPSKQQMLEQQLLDVTNRELNRHSKWLRQKGISWTTAELCIWDEREENRTSELKVEFYQDDSLYDIFEFHLFDKGKQDVTESELLKWISTNIRTLGAQSHHDDMT